MSRFHDLFPGGKPLIGIVRLGHGGTRDVVEGAIDDFSTYRDAGVDGVVFKMLRHDISEIVGILSTIRGGGMRQDLRIGVNVLPNEHYSAFKIAHDWNLDFVQLAYVAGEYSGAERIDPDIYEMLRADFHAPVVLGGVHPKEFLAHSDLEDDIRAAMGRADALVVTGPHRLSPIDAARLHLFRSTLGDYPLLAGSGITIENVGGQLGVADGAIVYSSLLAKGTKRVDYGAVRALVDAVSRLRGPGYRATSAGSA